MRLANASDGQETIGGDNRCRVWPRECKVCGRMIRLTNFMYRSAIDMEGNLVRSDTHEIRCRGWKAVPRDEWRFARQRRSLSELISYYYGAPGKPLACVACGSKELVLARPPQCATCRKKAERLGDPEAAASDTSGPGHQ